MENTNRTAGGLREVLFSEIDSLRSGESTAVRARAVASLGNAIVQSVNAEVECKRQFSGTKSLGDLEIGAKE